MADNQDKLGWLLSVAAGKPHTQVGLVSHLIATHEILRRWGMPESTCVAGLFHSIYGTAAYTDGAVSMLERQKTIEVIGKKAERLCYFFARLDRNKFFGDLEKKSVLIFRDRCSCSRISLCSEESEALVHILLANWLEQRQRCNNDWKKHKDKDFLMLWRWLTERARMTLFEALIGGAL